MDGCSSHICLVNKPTGQGTNGLCTCPPKKLRWKIYQLEKRVKDLERAAQPVYWLMDGRAEHDIDKAITLECCESYEEAAANINGYGDDTCIVEVIDGVPQKVLWCLLWGQPSLGQDRKE